MAYFGSYQIFSLHGPTNLAGWATRRVGRPGVNGEEVQVIGMRGRPFQMKGKVDCVDASSLHLAKRQIMSQQGSVINVTDDMGQAWNNYLVESVVWVREFQAAAAVGGLNNGTWFGEFDATLVPMSTHYSLT